VLPQLRPIPPLIDLLQRLCGRGIELRRILHPFEFHDEREPLAFFGQ
jgi:hypothetical protein